MRARIRLGKHGCWSGWLVGCVNVDQAKPGQANSAKYNIIKCGHTRSYCVLANIVPHIYALNSTWHFVCVIIYLLDHGPNTHIGISHGTDDDDHRHGSVGAVPRRIASPRMFAFLRDPFRSKFLINAVLTINVIHSQCRE